MSILEYIVPVLLCWWLARKIIQAIKKAMRGGSPTWGTAGLVGITMLVVMATAGSIIMEIYR